MITKQHFTRINRDTNGNPRYYLPQFMTEESQARKAGAVMYRGKRYGAGWVFQTYNLQHIADKLNEQ